MYTKKCISMPISTAVLATIILLPHFSNLDPIHNVYNCVGIQACQNHDYVGLRRILQSKAYRKYIRQSSRHLHAIKQQTQDTARQEICLNIVLSTEKAGMYSQAANARNVRRKIGGT